MKEVIFQYLDYVTRGAKLYKGRRDGMGRYYLIDVDKNEWYFDSNEDSFVYFSDSIYREVNALYTTSLSELQDIIKTWINNRFGLDIISTGVTKPPLDKFSNPIKMEELVKGLEEIPMNDSLNENVENELGMKPVIFQYLDYVTRGGVLYTHPHDEDMFFLINPKTKEWYFDLYHTFHIFFSYDIFNEINSLYSIWEPELLNLIKKWIKLRFNLESVTINLNRPVVDIIDFVLKHDQTNSDESINENVDEPTDRSKLKEIVFSYLNHITQGSKVYGYNNGLWIINPKTKYWYFERTDRDSTCTVRENILDELTNIFNLIRSDLLDIMGEWSETIFNEKINELNLDDMSHFDYVNDVIDNGVEVKTLGDEIKDIYESVNSDEKLEELLFTYLDVITEGSKIYHIHGSDWIINPDKKYWYVELLGSGTCVFRCQVTGELIKMFNLERSKTKKIIQKWVEKTIKRNTKEPIDKCDPKIDLVKRVIKYSTEVEPLGEPDSINEQTINSGLKELIYHYLNHSFQGSDIYKLGGSDWIINPEENQWYVEFTQSDTAYINHQLTNDIVNLFNLNEIKAITIIKGWVSKFFGRKVKIIYDNLRRPLPEVVLQHGIKIGPFNGEIKGINEGDDNNEKLKEIIFHYLDVKTEGYNLYDEGNGRFWITNPNDEWCIFLGDSIYGQITSEFIDPISFMFNTSLEVCVEITRQWMEKFFSRRIKKVNDVPERFNTQVINDVIKRRKIKPIKITKENEGLVNEGEENNEKLKELVFSYLDTLTDGSRIYEEKNFDGDIESTWIINPETQYWFFEIEEDDRRTLYVNSNLIQNIKNFTNLPKTEIFILHWFLEKYKTNGVNVISGVDWERNGRIRDTLKQNKEIKSLNDNKIQEMKETIKKAIDSEFTQAASGMDANSFATMQKKSNSLQGQLEGETTEATSAGSAGGYSAPLTKMETKEEKLKGGLADKKTFNDLMKKHSKIKNVEAVLKDQLRKGIKVELEHTDDRKVAKEIAMDHLYENPKYYDKLKKVEATEATGSSSSGQYSGPAFLAKSTKKKDWRGASKPQIPGGKFVEVKKKCNTFPYCNQGDIKALKIFENDTLSRVIAKVSKEHNISETVIKNIILEELKKKG